MSTRVIGLDLSLTSTGVAIIDHYDDGPPDIEVDRITSKPAHDATLAQRHERLVQLTARICARVSDDLALVVIEGPSLGQARQGGQHDRAGLWWLLVAHIIHERWPGRGIVAEVPPATLKRYATGRGNAGKDEVLASIVRRYPSVPVAGNDQADALVLAAMGSRHLGRPVDTMPQAHLTAMGKVRWP